MNANELVSRINSLEKSMLLEEFNAYAVNASDMRGVAVITSSEAIIDEEFNQVKIKNFVFSINGKEEKVVFLFTKKEKMSDKYGMLCLDFLDPKNRDIIVNNPIEWFDEWRNLLGDYKKDKMIYDILGEMKVLLELQRKKENPIWDSIGAGTFDITSDKAVYEVKTSKSKTEDCITIHSQFQLEKENLSLPLYIAYIRLEESDAGESIDTIYNELINEGFNSDILDDYLNRKKYQKGKSERYKRYVIHEQRLYLVDDSFPKITNESFKDNKIPGGIINYQYTVSLNGLDYEIFD